MFTSHAKTDGERNQAFIRQQLSTLSAAPAEGGKKPRRIYGVRAKKQCVIPRRFDHFRVLIESPSTSIKRKFTLRALGHSLRTRMPYALFLGLRIDLYGVGHG
jgi:hypothetical protein